MPTIILTNGTRKECQRVEIDYSGSSVVEMDSHTEVDTYPFFHVGQVVFDDGTVFIEDDRE